MFSTLLFPDKDVDPRPILFMWYTYIHESQYVGIIHGALILLQYHCDMFQIQIVSSSIYVQ